ncbi:MAG: ECF transporter S component [Gudongella sp.]|jgi:riboflavin transporter FmnP|nr:ECF transporter S component [Gudongella sp.]
MNTRKIAFSAMFIALGLVLPIAFHSFNMGGPMFLPMHIPVLMAGILLGPVAGLFVGIVTPILSSVMTGMPPMFPMLPIMIAELGIYGLSSGYIAKIMKRNAYVPLLVGMVDGRIAASLMVFIMSKFFGAQISAIPYIKGAIITGLPGILIQLVIIPPIIKLMRNNLSF